MEKQGTKTGDKKRGVPLGKEEAAERVSGNKGNPPLSGKEQVVAAHMLERKQAGIRVA